LGGCFHSFESGILAKFFGTIITNIKTIKHFLKIITYFCNYDTECKFQLNVDSK
jgi:hypothetical protein